MAVSIRLKEYLEDLKQKEEMKDGVRLQVPSLYDLAGDTGIHYTTLNRIARDRITKLDLKKTDQIIKTMRKRGFNMDITDLIVFKDD